jgi:prepilin-type N-terminal cleavage/methylation domain-containing protein
MNRFSLPPRPTTCRAVAGGFTLVETLVTVAIAAALLAAGVPTMRNLLARHAVAAQANELRDALHLARSEAMKRGGPVILCKTDPVSARLCSTDARVGWQTWMVFADANRSGVYQAGDAVVRAQATPPSRMAVTSDTRLVDVRFEATGIARASTAASGVVFVLSPAPPTTPSEPGASGRAAWRQVCLNSRGDAVVLDGNGVCP